ncbi:hypothetical protein EMPS_04519 [Entomortierella parvispora]|uniref:Uncharacterized protein n=1 Tax=Entomortierella parvispora TaxID=205924 RepID=A0A9P3H8T2_9FUNG|nr:hypothetical protein EMPS_04519 [Entomortierella parvispora]
MGFMDKFFGVLPPSTGAPILAVTYALIGLVFTMLCFGRWIMPHAETDLAIPWAIVCILLFITGAYGFWAVTRGSIWHHRQFVSASWGFLLMFLCWAIVYIAVEDHYVAKVNTGCLNLNPQWSLLECDDARKSASLIAIILTSVGIILGVYFTLVISHWVTALEWEQHLENERKLELWRNGKGEDPLVKDAFVIDVPAESRA